MQDITQELLDTAIDYFDQKDYDNAEIYFAKVAEAEPNNPTAYYNLGLIYKQKEEDATAELCFKKCIELAPHFVLSYQQLGLLYLQHEAYPNALEAYQLARKIEPADTQILANIANIHTLMHNYEEALKVYEKLRIVYHDNVEILCAIGSCYQKLNQHESAKQYYLQALQYNPNHTKTLFYLSFIYLLQKEYSKGFELYRNRYHPDIIGDKLGGVAYPPTQLHAIEQLQKETTLYISHEQGLGDTIMFARYFLLFAQKCNNIISYVPPSLKRLLQHNFSDINFIDAGGDISFDYNTPLMEGAYLFETTFETIPAPKGYLSVAARDVQEIKKHLHSKKKNIILVYRGKLSQTTLQDRSIELEKLLLSLQNMHNDVAFFCAQVDATEEEKTLLTHHNVIHLGDYLTDFYDTAALFSAADLVVSVDTAALNLAGALGVKTLGILGSVDLWRWVHNKENKVAWYNSVSTLQQQRDALDALLQTLPAHIEAML